MTYNLRAPGIPHNSLIMDVIPALFLPNGYVQESTLFDKYPKGIPDLCTGPGGTLGAHTHSESATSFNHGHTGSLGSHNHAMVTAGSNSNILVQGGGTIGKNSSHFHTFNAGTISGTPTICNADQSHTHLAAQPTEAANETIRYLKKTISDLRSSGLPVGKVVWYGKTIASLPTLYSVESTIANNRFFKGTPDGCTSPGTEAGTDCHTHPVSSTTHTHGFCFPSHVHVKSTNTAVSAQGNSGGGIGSRLMNHNSHVHPTAGINITATQSGTTANNTTHSHASSSHLPLHRELLPVKVASISMRNRKMPIGTILGWLDTLATVPDQYQVADGTNSTLDTLDRYARSVPCDTTNPGTGGGNATHQHATGGTHSHTLSHTHAVSGATGAASVTNLAGNFCCVNAAAGSHGHANNTIAAKTGNALANGAHQHATTNNDAEAVRMAYIENIV